MKIFLCLCLALICSFTNNAQTKKVSSKNEVGKPRTNNVIKKNNQAYISQSPQNYNRNYSQSVRDFIEGKYFRNLQTGLRIKYGYISLGNTYGLTFTSSYGNEFYFINCSDRISSDKQYMELTNCINTDDGSGIGRVGIYKDRVIISASDCSFLLFRKLI